MSPWTRRNFLQAVGGVAGLGLGGRLGFAQTAGDESAEAGMPTRLAAHPMTIEPGARAVARFSPRGSSGG